MFVYDMLCNGRNTCSHAVMSVAVRVIMCDYDEFNFD